jgi:hypothetical protein
MASFSAGKVRISRAVGGLLDYEAVQLQSGHIEAWSDAPGQNPDPCRSSGDTSAILNQRCHVAVGWEHGEVVTKVTLAMKGAFWHRESC